MIWPETELTGPDPMLDELRAIRDEIGPTPLHSPIPTSFSGIATKLTIVSSR